MKILVLSSFFPYPLFSGGQVRLYNLLRNLGKKHEITLVCETRGKENAQDFFEIKKYCRKIMTVKREKQWSLGNILKCGFSRYPFLMTGHQSNELKLVLKKELEAKKYDLIAVETFYVMQNLPQTEIKIILTEYNIEYQIYESWVKNFRLILLKPLLYLDILKLKFWEKYYWQKADQVVTVSETDKKLIEKTIKKKVSVVPNGMDFAYFSEVKKTEPKTPTIVFCGSFRWVQNKDAVSYLLKNLWPQIKKSTKVVKLWIVGNDAHKYLNDIDDEQILIEDSIADIREVYSKATLLLAPIRIGGGTKFKILESMASGLPVVTTPMGVEGLGTNTNGLVIGNTDEELIEQVAALLVDEKKRKEISQKEKDFMRKNFDWEEICEKLEKVYKSLVK